MRFQDVGVAVFFEVCMNTQRTTSFLHFITKTRQNPDGYEGGEAVPRDKFITEMSGRISSSLVVGSVSQVTTTVKEKVYHVNTITNNTRTS